MPEASPAPRPRPSPARRFFEWIRALLYATVLFFLLLHYVFGWYLVPTPSMEPTIRGAGPDHPGDTVLVDKLTYRLRDPRRGEVIVFWPPPRALSRGPSDPAKPASHPFVKRLVGLPGETIEIRNGRILVNGSPVEIRNGQGPLRYVNLPDHGSRDPPFSIPPDSYFVLGDNTERSEDSRRWGCVPRSHIFGRALFVFWPPSRFGRIR